MSVHDAVARVHGLHQLAGLGRPPATPATPNPGFSAVLDGATASGAGGVTAAPAIVDASIPAVTAPRGAGGAGVSGVPFAREIDAAAIRHRIDPALLTGLIRAESNFDPRAVSPAGARGLTQLMPGTAAALGVTDAFDPVQAIGGGARYLREQLDRFGGDPVRALAAYNAGPGAVIRHGGVPPYAETQAYVRKVQDYAAEYRRDAAPAAGAEAAAQRARIVPPAAALGYSTI